MNGKPEQPTSTWKSKTHPLLDAHSIYRKEIARPGQVVHYPATVLLDPAGKEVFRHVGKNNGDRLSFGKLAEKVGELTKAKP